MKGFLRALVHGIKDAIADLGAAVSAVVARQLLLKPVVERARLEATLADEMSAPEIAEIGIGAVDDARLAKSIAILVKAENLPRAPTPAEVFDPAFLPPLADRPTAVH